MPRPTSLAPLLRRALPAAALLTLAGCSTFTFDYRGLTALAPEGDDFNAELAREYQAFAATEANAMMDWIDAAYFGEKAFTAARDETTEPETLAGWRLPADARAPLADGRERLVAVLVRGARTAQPKTAAQAQAKFDCWIEQQEENWQTDDIARCRDGFFAALNELEERLILSPQPRLRTDAAPSPASASPVTSPSTDAALSQVREAGDGGGEPQPKPKAEAAPLRIFTVFFPFDSAVLDDSGLATVRAIAQQARLGSGAALAVAGHADRAGGEAYNLALSKRRADAVAHALETFGVPGGNIEVRALGEATPLVATGDGVREAKNRRVEITTQVMP